MGTRGRVTRSIVDDRFSVIGASDEEREVCENVATFYRETAHNIAEILPEGRNKNIAISCLEEAMYWSQRSAIDGIRHNRPVNYQ